MMMMMMKLTNILDSGIYAAVSELIPDICEFET